MSTSHPKFRGGGVGDVGDGEVEARQLSVHWAICVGRTDCCWTGAARLRARTRKTIGRAKGSLSAR